MADVEQMADDAKDKLTGGDGGLARKLITPVAAGLGTLAASYAAKKGPELLRDRVLPRLEGEGEHEAGKLGRSLVEGAKEKAGSQGGMVGKAAEKVLGGGGEQPEGWGRGRRLPVQASIDVAVPVEKAYEAWTDFERLPEFMHRVESVDRAGDDAVVWHENIWGIRRDWKAEIVEQRPNEVIAWRSTSRGGNAGVVTFHELADRLTRVEANVDFQPQGLFEKLASGLRFHRRAARSDLRRFKAYVEMRENAHAEERSGRGSREDRGEGRASANGSSNGSRSSGDLERERRERGERRRERREHAQA